MSRIAYSRRATLSMLLASAGLAAGLTAACARTDAQTGGAEPASSEGGPSPLPALSLLTAPSIARSALVHDALMLLASDRDLHGEWQDMLLPLPTGKPFEFSYAYGVASLQDNGDLAVGIAREVRDGWSGRDAPFLDIQRHKGEMLERRLAMGIGWAADRMGSRILLDGFAEEGGALAADGVFIRALLGSDEISKEEAAKSFRVLYERAFVAMHTLEPDLDGWGGLDIAAMHEVKDPKLDDVNRFIDDYVDWVEGLDLEVERLAAAVAGATPDGVPVGAAFYRPGDPIVVAAENLRVGNGKAYAPGHWDTVTSRSRYGQALTAAHRGARLMLDVARGERALDDLSALAV